MKTPVLLLSLSLVIFDLSSAEKEKIKGKQGLQMTFRTKQFLVCAKERLIFQFWQGQELRNPPVSDFGETRNTSALGRSMERKRCASEVKKF